MKTRAFSKLLFATFIAAVATGVTSCSEKKFHVNGTITEAKDSILYFEHMGLNGPVVADSAILDESGTFAFDGKRNTAPEFYRLRISGQIINVAIDSTETVTVKAAYPAMSSGYDISGSADCSKIKELALMQMSLQGNIDRIVADPAIKVSQVGDSVLRVIAAYKNRVKTEYIYKEPMKPYAYFALFQTIRMGYNTSLIFNPRSSEDDVKVFAAVATSWDTFYPEAERGKNLHNIAIEGMKDIRIMRGKQNATIDPGVVNTSGVIDINLSDNQGRMRSLSSLKGKVVLLDFHLFSGEGSMKRIMMLRELYNKYHSRGLEVYQVSVDADEHFWKLQTAALPWISVRADNDAAAVLSSYNVQAVPTFFLLGKDTNVYKRDLQVKDIDAEIQSLL